MDSVVHEKIINRLLQVYWMWDMYCSTGHIKKLHDILDSLHWFSILICRTHMSLAAT